MARSPSRQLPLSRFAHLRAYPAFDAPCLTCHVVIRIDKGNDPSCGADEKRIDQRRVDWVGEVNRLLALLDWHQPDAAGSRRYDAPPVESEGIRSKLQFGERDPREAMCLSLGFFGQFAMHVIVEINAEYTAVSLRASQASEESQQCDRGTTAATQPAYDALCMLMTSDIDKDPKLDPLLDSIFHKFWDAFFTLRAGQAQKGKSPRDQLFDPLGERIIEFQGVILRTKFWRREHADAGLSSLQQGALDLQAQLEFTDRNRGDEDGYRAEQVGPVIQDSMSKDPDDGERIRARLLAFVNDRPTLFTRIIGFRPVPGQEEGRINTGNTVLCHLFSNKAVYGSSLKVDHGAVRFFLVYGGPSRHQLGRLVMALHHCGELRFATLFDSQDLLQVSDKIRVLDMRLNAMRQHHPRRMISERNREITQISQLCRGGLAFRIAQAHFYQEALEKLLKDLRVKRIIGWQSYDGVVRRNVARRLDGIASIGQRFDALQARFLQLADVAQQGRLVRLQLVGEWFAMVATVYYGGSVIYWLFEALPALSSYVFSACALVDLRCEADPATDVSHSAAEMARTAVAHLLAFAFSLALTLAGRWIIYPMLKGVIGFSLRPKVDKAAAPS